MLSFTTIKTVSISTFHRTSLILSKNAPAILTGVGILGSVTSTVLACRATLKVETVMKETQEDIDKVKDGRAKFDEEKYSDQDYKADLASVYIRRAWKLASLYGPSVAVGAISVGCLIGGHNILNKRNLALMGSYTMLDEAFKAYRARVEEKFGKEEETSIKYGGTSEEVTETVVDEEGKKSKVKKKVYNYDNAAPSQYARYFGPNTSSQWRSEGYDYNMFFLTGCQTMMNKMLKIRGHVFLNEVYDQLGLERTPAGQLVGWLYNSENGDEYIDFNLNGVMNDQNREWTNGNYPAILLDFNVDGIIFSKLEEKGEK